MDATTDPIEPSGSSAGRSIIDAIRASLTVVGGLLLVMWVVEIADTAVLNDRLQSNGIRPRTGNGLDGVLWSPFLHSGFPHLISNTIPFLMLSALTLTGGLARYIKASAIIILLGGGLVWAFAIGSNENHIGASGWVFGLLGFLLAAAVIERKPATIAAGLIALVFYWSLIFGFVPTEGISWEGHLFGFIAGIVAAKLIAKSAPAVTGAKSGGFLSALQPPEID